MTDPHDNDVHSFDEEQNDWFEWDPQSNPQDWSAWTQPEETKEEE